MHVPEIKRIAFTGDVIFFPIHLNIKELNIDLVNL
jgi:hypothetical protein